MHGLGPAIGIGDALGARPLIEQHHPPRKLRHPARNLGSVSGLHDKDKVVRGADLGRQLPRDMAAKVQPRFGSNAGSGLIGAVADNSRQSG